jgi:hypothetical protein
VHDVALYTALVLLSLVEVFVGCAAEVVASNIVHVKNGRKPNAGCAILPLVPILQIAYVLAAMGLNHLAPYLGYGAVGGLCVINACRSYWNYVEARPQLETLLARQSGAS